MLLKSLHLMNIRGYEKAAIEFPSGYILFRGDSGSGKSTILMAIEFALFGLGSLGGDALLSKKKERAEVVIVFEEGGITYEVGRVLARRNNRVNQVSKDTYIRWDGKREPLTPSDLKARILQILNFREPSNPRAVSRVYRYAVYMPQGEMKSILEGDQDVIRKAFGLDDYKVAHDNCSDVGMDIKNTMRTLSAQFAHLDEDVLELEQTQTQLKDTMTSLETLKRREPGLLNQKEEYRLKVDSAYEQVRRVAALRTEMRALGDNIKKTRSNIEAYKQIINGAQRDLDKEKERLARYNKTRPTKKTHAELDNILRGILERDTEIKQKRIDLNKYNKTISDIGDRLGNRSLDVVKNTVIRTKNKMSSLDDSLESVRRLLQEKMAKKGAMENEVNTMAASLSKASSLGDTCEYCGSALTLQHVKELKNTRRAMLEGSRTNLNSINGEIKKIRENISDSEKNQKTTMLLLEKLQSDEKYATDKFRLELERDKLRADLDLITRSSPDVYEDGFPPNGGEQPISYIKRLRHALQEYVTESQNRDNTVRHIKGHQDRIEKQKSMMKSDTLHLQRQMERQNSIDAELSNTANADAELERCQAALDNIQSVIARLHADMSVMQERRKHQNDTILKLDRDILEARKHQEKHDKYKDYSEWLDKFFIKSLDKIEKSFMASILYEFEDYYQKWYDILVDDTSKISRIDDQFRPMVEQDGYDQEVANMSGGEKTSIALAYRLALNSTMRSQTNTLQSNLLILDEPTDGFSKAQLEKVHNILDSLHSDQIIMVSHEVLLEGYVDHVFEVTKNDGISSVNLKS